MLKTETTSARGLSEHDLLTDGNVLLEKSYSATDDKFILTFMRLEDVRKVIALMEEGTEEADRITCDMWIENTTMIVAKPDDKFQTVPDEAFDY